MIYQRPLCFLRTTVCFVLLLSLFLSLSPALAAPEEQSRNTSQAVVSAKTEESGEQDGAHAKQIVALLVEGATQASDLASKASIEGEAPTALLVEGSSDEYGAVTQEEAGGGEGPQIADPIEPWNRAMYHVNDKLYFWLLKPVATGYAYILPDDVRALFSNFYRNITAPIRIVNNILQGKPEYAGTELARFLINSVVGVGGLRDVAKECFGIDSRKADFGQTLGKYGVGFGFYIVWPVLGPSSPRDTVGLVGDWFLTPQTYASPKVMSQEGVILLHAHEKINDTSLRIGDYEALKGAAIDPYIAMRDAYVQHRKKLVGP